MTDDRPARALVTGASGDIGLCVTERLIANGMSVAAQYHTDRSGLDKLATRHPGLQTVRQDLLADGGPQALVRALPAGWKELDVLVNCVGGARPARFTELPTTTWEQCLSLNVTVPFLVMRHAVPLLQAARGCVINLSSVAAMTGGAFGPHYAAAKAALIGLSRSAARELGPLGIRVNVVAPGPVRSRMTDALSPAQLADLLTATALGRVVDPGEVADVTYWLARATAVTGQTVIVDGGRVFG